MLKKSFVIASAIGFTHFCFSQVVAQEEELKELAIKMIPDSKFIFQDGLEFSFQTTKGIIVEIELNSDGSLDEASGDAIMGGDQFLPGGKMISLEAAVSSLQKSGKNPTGDWSFEKSMRFGWVYEIEGFENGKKVEYLIDAENAKLLKKSRDF